MLLAEPAFLTQSESEDINMIALLTPNCLDGEQLTLDASKIANLIKANKDTYIKDLTKRYKDTFKLGKKQNDKQINTTYIHRSTHQYESSYSF